MRFLNFYVNSSIHVALAVYSLTWITLLEYHIPYDETILYFIFYASITGYNFVKYFGVAKFHHRNLTIWLKAIQIFSFVCFLGMCYYAFQLSTKILFYILCFGTITFFYAIPFLPRRVFLDKHHNLRNIGGLKIYVIASVWCGVTVFLPLINDGHSVDFNVIITSAQRFIFVIVLMLPFEIRDMRYDSLKLSTVPQKIGIRQTKIMGGLLLIIFLFLEFFKDKTQMNQVFVLLIISMITLLFLVFSKKEQGKYYSALGVEALPILWLILLLLF